YSSAIQMITAEISAYWTRATAEKAWGTCVENMSAGSMRPSSAHARPAVLPATTAVTMVAARNAEKGGVAGSRRPRINRTASAVPAHMAAKAKAFGLRGSIATPGNRSNTRVPVWGIGASARQRTLFAHE